MSTAQGGRMCAGVGRSRAGMGLMGVLMGALPLGACNGPGPSCSGPTSFQVFEPDTPTSAIPLCTTATDATAASPSTGGGPVSAFGGAPLALSDAGIAQCTAVCPGAASAVPCCQSQWEPRTILCTPACQ